MNIFQNIVLKKYVTSESDKIKTAYVLFTAFFHKKEIQENILKCNEEQFQEGFLREFFVKILGYTLNPDANYNLITERKNENDSKKADGALIIKGEVVGIIELKDHKTINLKQIETQAFGYKNNHRKASYVVTSNFEKLRFYIDNAIDFVEFNLFTLTSDEFALLWLCLAYENIAKDLPKQLKAESVSIENDVTKKLYKDYSEFKRALFADLVVNNPTYDQLVLFKKSQKLLDRLLFILFAEDCGLLPANSMKGMVDKWQDFNADPMNDGQPLYSRFQKYFHLLNVGHRDSRVEVFAYNGGLFKPDEVLDVVMIGDKVLFNHTLKLAEYNFASEVDVNILGHIFENSLTEIEEITNSINAGEAIPQTSKRKKEGVFYTPRYITTYIVENTLGKLCVDKKAELEIVEAEYFADKKRKLATKKKLDDKLKAYREWLLQLTICDPACGSGAFLNAALDYLMSEHRLLDELTARLLNHSITLPDIENAILEHNLFGVDINEESVEIAKLALWLRTAKPHRKLNSLNNNIKCGNSLISDPEVAGEKAFDWHHEFPQVFAKGGFDVVIGNPPYVHLESIRDLSQALEKTGYITYDKRGDLYCLFVERGFQIIKEEAYMSFIMPNKWLQAGYGKSLRELLLSRELIQLVDFGDIQIFEGATTYPCIFVSKKSEPKKEFSVSILQAVNASDFYSNVELTREVFFTNQFGAETWIISSQKDKQLLERLRNDNETLEKYIGGEAYYGVKTGLTEAFLIDEFVKNKLALENSKEIDIIKPVIRGRDIQPWSNGFIDSFIIGTFPALHLEIDEYPAIKNYLLSFGQDRLEQSGKKGSRKKTNNKWFETQDAIGYYEQFSKPKIMYQAFQVKPCFIYDEQGLFCNNSMWFIPTNNKALLAILNSKMGWWLITKYCTQIQNGCQLIWKYFGQIPIAKATDELAVFADKMLGLNAELQERRERFLKRLTDNLQGIRITGALERFEELDFKGFLDELKKQKIAIPLKEQGEWDDFFNISKSECQLLITQINATDQTIDKMVYELYGLSEEEIMIVEKQKD